LQVAAELVGHFEDGVTLVVLAPISDPALVIPTVAQTLGLREAGDQPLIETLKRFLRERQLLLVLDNFEQVLPAAPAVGAFPAAAPKMTVRVTSRAILHVRGEKEHAVAPLATPDPGHRTPSAADLVPALSQYSAVALFVERALVVAPDFAVTNENAPAVAEIC